MSEVLDTLRRKLAGPDEAGRRRAVEDRLAQAPGHRLPARLARPQSALAEDFRRRIEAQHATTERAPTAQAAAVCAARYCAEHNLPARGAVAPDLSGLDFAPFKAEYRAPIAEDEVGISRADAGIAETGTLALFSGAGAPITLAFVPETHVVLLSHADIVGPLEAVWQRQRRRFPSAPPRSLCLISGPSRTGDIEQVMYLGAHGPKRLHVILHG